MDAISVVILGVIIVTLLVLYRLDLLPGLGGRFDAPSGAGLNPYSAVSIRCAGPCEAALSVKGQRFLGSEAPALPLQGCSAETCHCRYVHHVDRRTGILDRRSNRGEGEASSPSGSQQEDQREGRGRRASDWIAAYQLNVPQH